MKKQENKPCKDCGLGAPDVEFYTRPVNGLRYNNIRCKKCQGKYARTLPGYSARKKRGQVQSIKVDRENRRSSVNIHKVIYRDCKNSDRKHSRTFDLDHEFVKSAIEEGCVYCEDTTLRMTMDRIDNTLGHTKDNVVSACIRCNYLRRDMPYEAWMALVPSIRAARIDGLFGTWLGNARKSVYNVALAQRSIPVDSGK